jgi:acyl-CoA reductase-like NAD-dependent aldehyde dehydrogenase
LESCPALQQVVPQLLNQLSKHQQVIMLMELIGDILPAGVLNIVTGFGAEAGQALATSTNC